MSVTALDDGLSTDRICVCLGKGGSPDATASPFGHPAFVELRLDLMDCAPSEAIRAIPSFGRTIVTCRPGRLPEKDRVGVLLSAIDVGTTFIDLELDSPLESIRTVRRAIDGHDGGNGTATKLILSHHDFDKTPQPEVLAAIFRRGIAMGADLVKVACHLASSDDETRLFTLLGLEGSEGRVVPVGMGGEGLSLHSRALALRMGVPFTYAAPDEGVPVLEGQPCVRDLLEALAGLRMR